ncbi:MAG: hypothetical protein Q8R67_03890 [Rhodoferax sp.]|nr:hypothetical protein [Rhodoferax sp.]MDP3650806.1 hypothetical protein [Rhodoferax sp.]
MSYVLHVWDDPIAVNVVEALSIAFDGDRVEVAQNQKFIAFAKTLTDAFPDLSAIEETDEGIVGCVWTDSPMDGKTNSSIYVIGIATGHLDGDLLHFFRTRGNQAGHSVLCAEKSRRIFGGGQFFKEVRSQEELEQWSGRFNQWFERFGAQQLAMRDLPGLSRLFDSDWHRDVTLRKQTDPEPWFRFLILAHLAHSPKLNSWVENFRFRSKLGSADRQLWATLREVVDFLAPRM